MGNLKAAVALERTGHSKGRLGDLSQQQKDRLSELSTSADIRLAVNQILSEVPVAAVSKSKSKPAPAKIPSNEE